jgi:hypothetical protein
VFPRFVFKKFPPDFPDLGGLDCSSVVLAKTPTFFVNGMRPKDFFVNPNRLEYQRTALNPTVAILNPIP